ncbi:MAG: 1-deoxy-D-xylulose-5-phosphate reductoisomerase [Candidatus Hydrogenedentes bacterium]|nr:1-deoxy-D-xylulose-5-phosphate reductoisomerase [Candidatus Hydrogenedentota bacterium]
MATTVTILGSTGSIGQSALDVVRHSPDLTVRGLAVHSNIDGLTDQIAEFRPEFVAISDDNAAKELSDRGIDVPLRTGPEGVAATAAESVDVVLCAMAGSVGLDAILAAIEAENRIALANKEPLVMAGSHIMERARAKGVRVLPVDSEHNAIFQCLEGHSTDEVYRIHLTASGGPFYGRTRDSLRGVSPEEAANHPTWDMGEKISVDSATLMNKGLEIIEAMHLFDLPADVFEVVIHPQSIVHSMVEFTDGNILAHYGVTDMRLPIQFALHWPNRVKSAIARLDLTSMPGITFARPEVSEFPCLGLAIEAARSGGTAPTVLNAANEVAVEAFRNGQLPFLGIADVVGAVLQAIPHSEDVSLGSVLDVDATARRAAEKQIRITGTKST